MRARVLVVAAFGLALAAITSCARPADHNRGVAADTGANPGGPVKTPDVAEVVAGIVDRTNAFRNEEKREPVKTNAELTRTAEYFADFMAATDIPMLFLDRGLSIKRYTAPLRQIFNVKSHDHGRPIGDLTHKRTPHEC